MIYPELSAADLAAIVADVRITSGFSGTQYHVEEFPIGACVCREDGFNCLSFASKPGAKFTHPEAAHKIAERWNQHAIS